MGKTWRERIRPVVTAIQPVAKVAERVAGVAVHLQRPTIVGVVGSVSAGATALMDVLDGGDILPTAYISMLVSRGVVLDGLRRAGATTRNRKVEGTRGGENTSVVFKERKFEVVYDGSLFFVRDDNQSGLVGLIRQTINAVLPASVEIRWRNLPQSPDGTYDSFPLELRGLSSRQGPEVWAATQPLLDGGRCILLEGRPGVGKTTMAQEIAALAGLGRTVLLEPRIVGPLRGFDVSRSGGSMSSGSLGDALEMLSPGTIIVDDVDKISLSLGHLEALRRASKLVILTANNGKHDNVLDGAFMRAGRVDEVFTVQPERGARRPPFDRLTDAEWEEVGEWPIAYLNELEKRLLLRPNDVRLDDLRTRLTLRVRSGEEVYSAEPATF
jgi:hypothetical protein